MTAAPSPEGRGDERDPRQGERSGHRAQPRHHLDVAHSEPLAPARPAIDAREEPQRPRPDQGSQGGGPRAMLLRADPQAGPGEGRRQRVRQTPAQAVAAMEADQEDEERRRADPFRGRAAERQRRRGGGEARHLGPEEGGGDGLAAGAASSP